ncbi:MAG: spore coat associated protein CotJA [Ruminococcus sp.]|nr:spore coat associated protein CotJA [Ruminococcus sp.]
MKSYGIPPLPEKTVEGMAYVPFQPNGAESYTAVRGFEAGTMFPSLDKPWYGAACRGVMR